MYPIKWDEDFSTRIFMKLEVLNAIMWRFTLLSSNQKCQEINRVEPDLYLLE